MSEHCHNEKESCSSTAQDATATAGCCAATAESEVDSCCETPAQRDWFLWSCLVLVTAAALIGAASSGQHLHDDPVAVFTTGVYELLAKMWWGFALGIIFVGLLSRVPRELVMGILGREHGWSSLLRATFAGVLLDLCSHGILAVGMKLYERGASIGQVMAFLLASPWNSLSLTLILFGLIGVGWTLLFIVLSLVIGLITGAIFNLLVARGTLPDNPWRASLGEERPLAEQWREFRSALSFSPSGSIDILKEGVAGSRVVLRWGLFGILLAASVRALVPEEAFAAWFGASFIGLWLTLLASTIIEVCSEGATPIAADLMNRAKAPGNAFTFLMAGVATDYTEVMSIRDTTHSWRIALYLPLIAVPQVMVLGFILNQF